MMKNKFDTIGEEVIYSWLQAGGKKPFPFQLKTWAHILEGRSGLLNAPTGCGKTYAVFLPALIQYINDNPAEWNYRKQNGLQLLWVTPLRALAKDLQRAMQEVCDAINLPWQVGLRTGDVTASEKAKQKKSMPEVLIITPESLHLLLAQKQHALIFQDAKLIVLDEWHELMGNKRGVQVELALSRIKHIAQLNNNSIRIWAISATIGNLEQAMQVALGTDADNGVLIKADIQKQIEVESVMPDEIERFPWAGHLGISMVNKVLPIIEQSNTTLLFTNTRAQSEIWYHALLDANPDLAGLIALHHGSVDAQLRQWIEDALHQGILKVVVCTSSLDLGVDFRPVDTVIQVGSPKGVSRFLQRAGRSGHQPDAISKVYFLPTHSLELAEAAALQDAISTQVMEHKGPVVLAYDVLVQYLCTLAVGDGFIAEETYQEIKSTFCYSELTYDEWQSVLRFVTTGGESLQAYDEFKKVVIEEGVYRITSRKTAMRHRMSIGTIVSDAMLRVKFVKGGHIGHIEEYFISKIKPGDVFSLAGRHLEFVRLKDMDVQVRLSKSKKAIVPSWVGGRMPLSANLGEVLRTTLLRVKGTAHTALPAELQKLIPLFELQSVLSVVPGPDETLIEYIETRDGHHLFVYPFEGRQVHEVMASLLAFRISRRQPITFSIAMNDYGFELLSDQPIPVDEQSLKELFTADNLIHDIQQSMNATEVARRRFRNIATIAGLVFKGFPGAPVKNKHLQSSSSLLFQVFSEYDTDNLLIRQAYREAFDEQMEEVRLRTCLKRIQKSDILFVRPQKLTPFSFPIKVDSMRENLSSEQLKHRIQKMQEQLKKGL